MKKKIASIKAISKGEFTLTGINKFKVVTNRWKQTKKFLDPIEGGNGQNRLHLESRAPSWAGLWTLSYMLSIYGNDIPTGKPGPQKEEPQGSYLDSPSPKRIP